MGRRSGVEFTDAEIRALAAERLGEGRGGGVGPAAARTGQPSKNQTEGYAAERTGTPVRARAPGLRGPIPSAGRDEPEEVNVKARKMLLPAAAAMLFAGVAGAAEPVRIGVMATLEGTDTVLGEDGMRGFELAMRQWGYKAGGRDIEVIVASTDATPDSAVRAARKLVEQDGVDIVIGPLSGSEGIAIRDYCKTKPQVTFVNGASGAQETTLYDPCPHFFRFNMDGAQWSAGLGEYIFNEKGHKTSPQRRLCRVGLV